MLRLKMPDDTGLALPGSTPVTLIQVDSANLPYACHCPLCGGIFQLPESLLYRVEKDEFEDEDQGAEPAEPRGGSSPIGDMGSDVGMESETATESLETGGDEDVAAI